MATAAGYAPTVKDQYNADEFPELRDFIATKQADLAKLFDEHPKLDFGADLASEIKLRNDELSKAGAEFDRLSGLIRIRDATKTQGPGVPMPGAEGRKDLLTGRSGGSVVPLAKGQTIGDAYVKKLFEKGPVDLLSTGRKAPAFEFEYSDFMYPERKALLDTSGIALDVRRIPNVVMTAFETPRVASLFLQGETDQSAIRYLEETTATNAAAETAEGAAKPESALGYTERTEPVQKIATWIPVTDEALQDWPQLRSIIDGRLRLFIQLREDSQLLVGNGTSPNISGILDRAGIQTQAKGADPTPDAIYKAMTKIRVGAFADPTGVVMHPNDWQDIRLLRTVDGIYIWGSPADPGPERIWGLSVVQTTALTENTGLVGAFNQAQIFRREGIRIDISTEHDDFFTTNKAAIRAEERLALAVYRPAAFCTVTGI